MATVEFAPMLTPKDQDLQKAGVQPAHYREDGRACGFRAWYRLLLITSARGGPFKEMSYKYHNDNTSKVMMAQGVPDWAAKTHICRGAMV